MSTPGNLKFYDEIESIREEVAKLKQEKINKIIALGHSGIDTDIKIAREVADVDIVIGGHTNTFMYTGKNGDNIFFHSCLPLIRSEQFSIH